MHALAKKITLITLMGMILLTGCYMPARDAQKPLSLKQIYDELRSTLSSSDMKTTTPTPTENQQPANEESFTANDLLTIYLHPGLPENLDQIRTNNQILEVAEESDANIKILMGPRKSIDAALIQSNWIYVLVAPFYTVPDNISSEELIALWRGERRTINNFSRIYVTEKTKAAISTILGKADETLVNVINKKEMETIPVDDNQSLMILPFEDLHNQFKVIRIDGQAPINSDFEPMNYLLTTAIWKETNLEHDMINIPESNFNPDLRTVLVMTGVTALTRATAHKMEINGNQYPGQDIREWLTSADLTHISNEIPFASNCPSPNPVQENLIFCSSPERIELLEFVGADIIELTGNHLLDYGLDAINLTLEMYEDRDWSYYAGGWDITDAQSPALVTHNGNQLAFIGCNLIGPPNDWATTTKPGAAPCGDFLWMVEEIKRLKADGYLPIVTLQYAEDYTAYPSSQMVKDFQKLADAGAIVVNGSQAHTPKMMVFQGETFLHYGLGNLFFDQMAVYYNDVYLPGTREEFIDRLIFYDEELISIELLTAMLEDYARPRPMTNAEREDFLSRIFSTATDFIQ